MKFELRDDGPLVLFGGSGVVGRALVELLADHPVVDEARTSAPARSLPPLVLVGRDAARAAPVIEGYRARGGAASFVVGDLATPSTVAPLRARAVMTLVNDPADAVLDAVVAAGVPYVDIARWTSRVAAASVRLAGARPAAPIVLSSAWMGGLAPRVARALGDEANDALDAVDVAVRYAAADSSGSDSVAFMDRLAIPFDVTIDGRSTSVMPLSDTRTVDVGGLLTKVSRLDTPEQATLPSTLGVRTAALRIGFDDPWASLGLRALVGLGVFCALRADRFTGFRHALLRPSDADRRKGAETRFRVDVRTIGGSTHAATIVDRRGQAHLTAVGALLSLRTALAAETAPGVVFPEQDRTERVFDALARFGVDVVRPAPAATTEANLVAA